MISKDLMRSLSLRLEPVRQELKLRLYRSSLELIESQASDDASLFWKVPNRKVRNLRKLLGPDPDNRLNFFIIAHACRHKWALSQQEQPVVDCGEVLATLKRCTTPSKSDIEQRLLLPLETSVPKLNRRRLNSEVSKNLKFAFEENRDPSEPTESTYTLRKGRWHISAVVDLRAADAQASLEFELALGMGDLTLARQISLHSLLGIGQTSWDMAMPGQEGEIAVTIAEYCQFMIPFLSSSLKDLNPGIGDDEVTRAEREWLSWLDEVRLTRKRRSGTSTDS
jgi:hypothetical protein